MDDTATAEDRAIAGPSSAWVENDGNQSDRPLCNIKSSIKSVNSEDLEQVLSKPTVKESSDEQDFDADEDQAIVSDELMLEEQGYIDTDPLPEGWNSICHESGMNLYIGPGRVCTTARPYFLGAGSMRRHDVPRSAIPCLNYIFKSKPTLQTAQEICIPEEVDIDSDQVMIPSYEEHYATVVEEGVGPVLNVATVQTTNVEQDFGMVEVVSDSDDDDGPREALVIEEIVDDDDYYKVVTEETYNSAEEVSGIEDKDMVDCSVENDIAMEEISAEDLAEEVAATEEANTAQQQKGVKITVLQDLTIRDGVVTEVDKNLETAKPDIIDEAKNVSTEELSEYCEQLFLFKKIRVMRFNSWSERRQFSKRRKHVHQLHRPAPLEPKVIIKCPVQSKEGESSKKWLMNTAGKSHVCILHEYVQHSLKKQPKYTFSELENAATPYAATVTINDMKYGVGYGTSKKQAKSNAAKATLQILIPEIDKPLEEKPTISEDVDISNIAFFDSVRILDPRVSDFCARTTEPLPCDLLKACLQRNENIGEMNITYEGDEEMLKFTMTVGPHQATVSCKNKREAKQQAAQAILQKLHPHVHSWGALLRLYGSGGFMGFKEKLTQKSTEQNPALHVPQEHKVQAAVPSLNEGILQGLRGRFDLLRVKGLEVPYVRKEYSSQEVVTPPDPVLPNPE